MEDMIQGERRGCGVLFKCHNINNKTITDVACDIITTDVVNCCVMESMGCETWLVSDKSLGQ